MMSWMAARLNSGQKLGPYEVQVQLGAGGMGEVYRARDTRLDRTVAIKVLPTHVSSSPDLRSRFEREAKAISALQHPHICVLHDVGCQDGVDFLVMEYLEGETLFQRLARKPLTSEEAIQIAIQIADALEKAHRSGIVHRDLKPGNIMLTKGGAKLMDFGLAKPKANAGGGPQSGTPGFSAVATTSMASPATVAGTVLGTVPYMSPEQIQGKEADARSDIFAFGVALYEMLTGKRAFEGKSQLSVASAILEKEPEPISTLQPMTPSAVEHLVRTCLAKEPDDRFQSAHDLKLQLQWITAGGSRISAPAAVAPQGSSGRRVLIAAAIAGWVVAAVAGVALLMSTNGLTAARQLVRSKIEKPVGFEIPFVYGGPPGLSPDGQQLAFVASRNAVVGMSEGAVIFLRRMSMGESVQVAGTERGSFPFWSPDGKYIGFFADGKL